MLIGGGRDYAPSDVMYAVAPINKNVQMLNWKAKILLEEGLRILLMDI